MTRELDIGTVLILIGFLLIFAKPHVRRILSHFPLIHSVASTPKHFLNIAGSILITLGIIYIIYHFTGGTDCEQIQAMMRESMTNPDDARRIYSDEQIRECLRE